MQTVVEMPIFTRQAAAIFTENEKHAVIDFLSANPDAGDVIPGTGGVRKVRVPASGRGSRGGARVIYYFVDQSAPIHALLVYAKGEQTNLSPDQKRAVAKVAAAIKAAQKERT